MIYYLTNNKEYTRANDIVLKTRVRILVDSVYHSNVRHTWSIVCFRLNILYSVQIRGFFFFFFITIYKSYLLYIFSKKKKKTKMSRGSNVLNRATNYCKIFKFPVHARNMRDQFLFIFLRHFSNTSNDNNINYNPIRHVKISFRIAEKVTGCIGSLYVFFFCAFFNHSL